MKSFSLLIIITLAYSGCFIKLRHSSSPVGQTRSDLSIKQVMDSDPTIALVFKQDGLALVDSSGKSVISRVVADNERILLPDAFVESMMAFQEVLVQKYPLSRLTYISSGNTAGHEFILEYIIDGRYVIDRKKNSVRLHVMVIARMVDARDGAAVTNATITSMTVPGGKIIPGGNPDVELIPAESILPDLKQRVVEGTKKWVGSIKGGV